MKIFFKSRYSILALFFGSILLLGVILLSLPVSWNTHVPMFVNRLFLCMSALSDTGLICVPMSHFSLFGTVVILILLQLGGLGFIVLTTLYLLVNTQSLPTFTTQMVKEYFVDSVDYNPFRIIFSILIYSFIIEFLGVMILSIVFFFSGYKVSLYYILFHTVSAFCNAGFGLDNNNLFSWSAAPGALVVLCFLSIIGGIGFVVIRDIMLVITGKRRRLSMHSKVTLWMSLWLFVVGIFSFGLLELLYHWHSQHRWLFFWNGLFNMVCTRSAGFNFLPTNQLAVSTQLLSIFYMFIGGGSGSTAGGIKVTTLFVLIMFIFRSSGLDSKGIRLSKEYIPNSYVIRALHIFLRAILVVFGMTLALCISEQYNPYHFHFLSLLFEVTSAVGAVGLSNGVSMHLSFVGKLIITLTMFMGKIGLITLVISNIKPYTDRSYRGYKSHFLLG